MTIGTRTSYWIVSLVVVLATTSVQARDITLTGDPWPPYVEGEIGKEADRGVAVRLVRLIFDRIEGVTPRFPLIPWERALREVESGAMDGIVLLAKTPERERYMIYTDPLLTARSLVWYTRAEFPNGFEWSTISDFSGLLLGMVRGYDYGPEFQSQQKNGKLDIVEVNNVDQLFEMLARGRVDLALANDSVGYGLARSYKGSADIRAADKATGEDVYYIGFSRRSDAAGLVARVNEVIAGLRDEGVIDAIARGQKPASE